MRFGPARVCWLPDGGHPLTFLGNLIGFGLQLVLGLVFLGPLLVAVGMAVGRIPYRAWLAGLALGSAAAFTTLGGDTLYNLLHWTKSRPSLPQGAFFVFTLFLSPPLVLAFLLRRVQRRGPWVAAFAALFGAALVSVWLQYHQRVQRDQEQLERLSREVAPESGADFVPCWRQWMGLDDRLLLAGHVREGVEVTLLSDPFAKALRPRLCTAAAADYFPPVADPAVTAHVTAVGAPQGCEREVNYAVAALGRRVTEYRAVEVQPSPERLEAGLLEGEAARAALARAGLDAAGLDLGSALVRRASGPGDTAVLVSTAPLRSPPPSAFPCTEPALLVSLGELPRVALALPACVLTWNLFTLDGELFLAALTQAPTAVGVEAMDPDQTRWLFRLAGGALVQVWPRETARR